jgi:spore germination protein YaaH
LRSSLISLAIACATVACSSADDGSGSSTNDATTSDADSAASSDSIAHVDSGSDAKSDATSDGDGGTTAFRHHRCGWLFRLDDVGKATFLANADYFDVIHPTGWILDPTDAFTAKPLTGVPDAAVMAAAKAHGVAVWPMIASGDSAEGIAAEKKMWSDPTLRDKHVASIVDVVTSGGFAGIDVDYEHMDDTDGPAFVAFLVELAKALHAKGKQLSVASEALWTTPKGETPWDYPTFSANLDAVHLMAYDFHHPCCTHVGQVAPLGWVQDVCKHVAATAGANVGKFILGLPNYGYACATSKDCAAACTSAIAVTTDEMKTCTLNNNSWIAGRAPNCTIADGSQIYFDDTPSLEEKVMAAKDNGLGGVTEWTVGNEPDGFFAMVKTHY